MTMKPEVAAAIEEIRATFSSAEVTFLEDGSGGAIVFVERVDPGAPYQQQETWVGFRIAFQYPYADVYPHFVRGDLARVDGSPLGEAMTTTTFEGRSAVQISRKSNRLDPDVDSAALKLEKVLSWLRSR